MIFLNGPWSTFHVRREQTVEYLVTATLGLTPHPGDPANRS